jgi:SAM-dependent methyltransferase
MASIYKRLTEGTTTKPISVMLDRMNTLFPFSQATGIYDNGCGPGPVLSRIIGEFGEVIPSEAKIAASDFSEGMVEQVLAIRAEEMEGGRGKLWGRVDVQVRDAMGLEGVEDGSWSHVSAGFVYFVS